MPLSGSTSSTGRRFELLRKIGAGAFGEVYLAEQDSGAGFRRRVALKVLHRDLEGLREAATRMRDEARILGRLSHKNIVTVLDLVRLNDRWAVVMDYVPGADIEQVLNALESRGEAFPAPAALEVGRDLFAALHAAWTADDGQGGTLGVVHRDIKPSNLRLTPDGEIKVLDFGVARVEMDTREAKTRRTGWIGTERYMAPERILCEGDGAPGDVYAGAATVVELILGRPLGRTPVLPDRHHAFVEAALTDLGPKVEAPPEARAALLDVFRRALAADPEARPTAAQVQEQLDEVLPLVQGERLLRFARRLLPELVSSQAGEAASGTLQEGGSTPTFLEAPPTPSQSSAVRPADSRSQVGGVIGLGLVLIGGGGAAALVGLAALLYLLGAFPAAEPAPVIAAVPPPAPAEAAPAPEPAPTAVVAPAPAAEPAPASVVAPPAPERPAAAPRPKPAPAAAPAAPSGPPIEKAVFAVKDASSVSVRCGGTSGTGTASVRLTSFPAGSCQVEATHLGARYTASVSVDRPREVRCLVADGRMTCS